MISAIFACEIREAIISVLTELAASFRRSLNRADAEKELRARWSRAVAAVPTITEICYSLSKKSLDLSLVTFLEKKFARWVLKVAKSSDKVTKLATLRASLLTSLSVWLQQHTHFQTYTHVQEYLDHGQSEGGVRPSLSLIGLDHDVA